MIPVQTAAGHPVSHLVFSPDGATVAVAQAHYGVTLIDRATGGTRAVCALPRRDVLTGLAFCGGGRFLAAASPKGVEVFDAATGAAVAHSFHHMRKDLRIAQRGGELIGADKGCRVASVWAPEIGFVARNLVGRPGQARTVSPDGRFVVLALPDRYELFDIEDDRVVNSVAAVVEDGWDSRWVRGGRAQFCPLSRRFAINDGRTLDVYDANETSDEDGQYADTPLVQRANAANQTTAVAPAPHAVLEPVFALKPDKPAEAGAWHPPFALLADGRGLLVKRPRNRVQLWDAPTGTLVNEWSWRLEWVTCVAASADGQTAVAGGRFGRVLLWDLD